MRQRGLWVSRQQIAVERTSVPKELTVQRRRKLACTPGVTLCVVDAREIRFARELRIVLYDGCRRRRKQGDQIRAILSLVAARTRPRAYTTRVERVRRRHRRVLPEIMRIDAVPVSQDRFSGTVHAMG